VLFCVTLVVFCVVFVAFCGVKLRFRWFLVVFRCVLGGVMYSGYWWAGGVHWLRLCW